MNRIVWLRYGLSSVLVTGLVTGAIVAGCGDDATTGTPAVDGGVTGDTGPGSTDTGIPPTDSGGATDTGIDSGPPPKPATLFAVNAMTDIGNSNGRFTGGSIRVCYSIKGLGVAARPPLPDSPVGIPIGTGGNFPNVVPLETLEVTPIIVLAENLGARGIFTTDGGAAPPDCTKLLPADPGGPDGGAGLVDSGLANNKEFFVLDPIPVGTLKNDRTYMLLITGCSGDSTLSSLCGPGYVMAAGTKGNLKVSVLEMDRTTPAAATSAGFQVVNGSNVMAQTGFEVKPLIIQGTTQSILTPGAKADYQKISPKVDVTTFNAAADGGGAFFALLNPDGGAPLGPQPLNGLGSISQVSGDKTAAGTFQPGDTYTIIQVGDPGLGFDPTPNPDGGLPGNTWRGAHRLGFKNKP